MIAHPDEIRKGSHRTQNLPQSHELIAVLAVAHDVAGVQHEEQTLIGIRPRGDVGEDRLPLPIGERALVAEDNETISG